MDFAEAFKRKARELAMKLQDRFPGRLMLASTAVDQISKEMLLNEYIHRVHVPYGDRIRKRDAAFFMTTEDIDAPFSMISMLRGLWGDMDSSDHECVWRYLDIFEKIATAATSSSK